LVREVKKDDRRLYACEECGLFYEERAWAERCEKYCSRHHACSLEITSHAVRS